MGTLPAQGCGFTYDGENEGHGGFLATNIANQGLLVGWLRQTTPDIVMMHLGTNDVWNNKSADEILKAFDTLVGQMRQNNKDMKILVSAQVLPCNRPNSICRNLILQYSRSDVHQVAQIIPMNPSNCATCGQQVVALNKAVVDWAPKVSTASSPITVVDCWTGFDSRAMTGDGVHPNNAGNEAVANCWFDALVAAIKNV